MVGVVEEVAAVAAVPVDGVQGAHEVGDAGHRIQLDAGLEGHQASLKRALLKAYFTDGGDPSDPELLARVAAEVGLDGERARRILAGDEFAAEVRQREKFYLDAGIHSVPAVIIDDRHLIQGGQPPEVFEQALRQIAAEKA